MCETKYWLGVVVVAGVGVVVAITGSWVLETVIGVGVCVNNTTGLFEIISGSGGVTLPGDNAAFMHMHIIMNPITANVVINAFL